MWSGISNMCMDNFHNLYLCGSFIPTMNLGDSILNLGDTVLTGKQGAIQHGFIVKFDHEGNLKWAKSFSGTDNEYCNHLCYRNGYVYVSGVFSGNIRFGTLCLINSGFPDGYLAKIDTSGNYTWVKQIGGTGFIVAGGIAADSSNNVYLTGRFSLTVDYGPYQLTSCSDKDIFICKYNAAGNEQWVKQICGGYKYDYDIGDISLGNSGDFYLIERIGFDFSIDTVNLWGWLHHMLFKFDNNGNFKWLRQGYSTHNNNEWNSIAVDNNNFIFVAGYFEDTVVFEYDTVIGTSTSKGCIACYASDGTLLWVKQTSNTGECGIGAVHSANDSTLFLTGYVDGSVNFDNITITCTGNTSGNMFMARLTKGENLGQNEIADADYSLNVYPNPAASFLNIELRDVKFENSKLSLYNAMGSLVYEGNIIGNKMKINIGNLPSGLYVISILTKTKQITKQIIKE
jgi:hypothetical protein